MKTIKPLTIVKLLLVLVLVAGCIGILRDQLDKRQGAEDYAQAAELAGSPTGTPPADPQPDEPQTTDPNLTAIADTDLAALQAVNPDVIAWLWLPGTEISYPVLQGDDNSYYLKHTWNRDYSGLGSIFLDYRNQGFEDFNTLVYGHRMNNDTMFGPLRYFRDPAFLTAAPSLYLLDAEGPHRYDIFAAYEAPVDALVYTPGLTETAEQHTVLNDAASLNTLTTGLTPTVDDRLLTLVTCTGNGYATRWLIQAVEIQP